MFKYQCFSIILPHNTTFPLQNMCDFVLTHTTPKWHHMSAMMTKQTNKS